MSDSSTGQQPRPYDGPERPYEGADQPYDAVVLAGGGARRLGGTDKPALTVGGRPLLDRVLGACADAARTVVVGPRRPTPRPVRWAREDPPGGGPLAALAAGLRHTTADTVLVLSADLPFLRTDTVRTLLAACGPGAGAGPEESGGTEGPYGGGPDEDVPDAACEAAVLHDGRDQPLLAAYRAEPLRRELALLHAEYGGLGGLPLRLLLPELRLRRVTVTGDAVDALDCDTWDDIAAARARIREHGTVLDEWTAAVKAELGIEDLELDTAAILDLARDAAHGVARPAAPLTTFLAGYAAARKGGTPEDVAEAARRCAALAGRWAAEESPGESPGAGGADEHGKGTGTGR